MGFRWIRGIGDADRAGVPDHHDPPRIADRLADRRGWSGLGERSRVRHVASRRDAHGLGGCEPLRLAGSRDRLQPDYLGHHRPHQRRARRLSAHRRAGRRRAGAGPGAVDPRARGRGTDLHVPGPAGRRVLDRRTRASGGFPQSDRTCARKWRRALAVLLQHPRRRRVRAGRALRSVRRDRHGRHRRDRDLPADSSRIPTSCIDWPCHSPRRCPRRPRTCSRTARPSPRQDRTSSRASRRARSSSSATRTSGRGRMRRGRTASRTGSSGGSGTTPARWLRRCWAASPTSCTGSTSSSSTI